MNSGKCSRMDKMSDTIQQSITDSRIAYRVMLHMKAIQAKHRGNNKAEKAAKDELDKDSADISSAGKSAQAASLNTTAIGDDLNVSVRLSDLMKIFSECRCGGSIENGGQTVQQTQVVTFQQTIETEASLTYYSLEPVNGLVVRNRNLAETDRYLFEFQNGSTLKITDKWSNRSTTIWGDPHVDVSDVEGSNDGDFSDLKSSDKYTTFMLADGTRLTFTAKDNGVIEEVNIFKGSQHLVGIGSASESWSEDTALFADKVKNDGTLATSMVPVGDVVYAGGDGNDWFDAAKNLIWGKTTGPEVTTRPSSFFELQYRQRITQSLSVVTVNQSA